MPVALVTGGSAGLGRAVVERLAADGWSVVTDARRAQRLPSLDGVTAVAGDVADPAHRAEITAEVERLGRLDLLLNNASHLGPSPQPTLAGYPLDELARVYEVDVFAPVALIQSTLPWLLDSSGVVVNVSSDAAVEHYEGWAGYGSAKAALDKLTAVFTVECPELRVYSFDPGDMRTEMHQLAFPGEDISDRADPLSVVPALLRLLAERPPSARYRASDLAAVAG
jgi:NAD(P)-dependent dehydrogenase (short-subunit alcohol dehydrogenase family)